MSEHKLPGRIDPEAYAENFARNFQVLRQGAIMGAFIGKKIYEVDAANSVDTLNGNTELPQ